MNLSSLDRRRSDATHSKPWIFSSLLSCPTNDDNDFRSYDDTNNSDSDKVTSGKTPSNSLFPITRMTFTPFIPSPTCAEIIPGLWVGDLLSVSTDEIATSSSDSGRKKVVTVITILFEQYYIDLAKDYFELQHRQRKEILDGEDDVNDSLIRSRMNTTFIKHVVFTLEDKFDADLLSMLPSALAAIDEALGVNVNQLSSSPVDITTSSDVENLGNQSKITSIGEDDDGDNSPERICLVHCFKGMSRSVSVIIAYLLSRHSYRFKSFEEALQHVRNVRPIACPNVGFALSLRQFQKTIIER